jgi:ABC-type multidrug transport system fused ATPase/permease subunit
MVQTQVPDAARSAGAVQGTGAGFWEEGQRQLAAAGSDDGRQLEMAVARCRELIADDLLPPLAELIDEASHRRSELVQVVSAAFAQHLVAWRGQRRYQRLMRHVRAGRFTTFERVYRRPLALVERDWRRKLAEEATGSMPSAWKVTCALLPFAQPYWPSALAIVAFTLIGIAFTLSLPLTFRFLIDNVLSRRPLVQPVLFVGPAGYVIEQGTRQLEVLFGMMGALCLLYLLNAVARIRLIRTVNALGEALAFDVRRQMLGVVADLPAERYAHTSAADLEQRLVYDAAALQQVVSNGLVPMLAGGMAVVFSATALYTLQPMLTLVVVIGVPIIGIITRLRRRRLRLAGRERSRRLSAIAGRVGELVVAQHLVKTYLAAGYLLARLNGRLELHRDLNVAFAQESSLLGQVSTLVMYLTQVAVLLVGGYLVIVSDGQTLAPGGLAAFYVLLNQLFGPVGQIASARQALVNAASSVERVSAVLDWPVETDRPDAQEVGPLRDAIRFERASFGYDPNRLVLHELSLTIRAGTTVALVGATGSGKSTVAVLLTRLFEPVGGRITWDGVDVREARRRSLRQQVLLVPQEALLLGATVYENIRFGLAEVSPREVEHAARLAQAHEFIVELPAGYDTIVGERGVGLSGGQRQRLALARALVREPSVLILDEATSALDPTTQLAAQHSLREATRGRTVIKIAHRLETVVDADQIVVLEHGRIAEQGRHAELLKAGGPYARLFEDQRPTSEEPPALNGTSAAPGQPAVGAGAPASSAGDAADSAPVMI